MKKNRFKILTVACVVGANLMFSSCVDNLLNQTPGGELASSLYWKTESDAEYAVNGVYSQARAMFNRDYVFDGNTEYLRFRGNVGTSQATGDRSIAYRNGSYNNPSSTYGSSFDNYYQYAYATVNRANYAIQNIEKMLPDAKTEESKSDDAKEEEKEPERSTIYYVTDKAQQGQYIKMFKEQGMNAVILDHNIDTSFITQLEQRNQNYKFMRIDADVTDALKEEVSEEEMKSALDTLTETFRAALGKENLDVKVEKLKDASISSMITLSEEGRRMQDMMKMYNMGMDASMFGGSGQVLVLNANNKLVQYVLEHTDSENTPKICEQLYDLAQLSHGSLTPERMTKFIARSNEIMGMMLN